MFSKHSITGRIFISKLVGLIIGGLALIIFTLIPVETSTEFKIGFLLLTVTMGAMIGFTGIYKHHPLFPNVAIPWWIRSSTIGILFFLIMVLLAKEQMLPFMSTDIAIWTGLTSPYWALLDGAFLGGLIGYITTKICGEGNLPIR